MMFCRFYGSLGFVIATVLAGRAAEDLPSVVKEELFYKGPSVFSTQPSSQTTLMQSVDRFGPVGIGIELHPPAFVMKVKNVEPGSPAEATGKLKAGQIIETINGQTLRDIDPRIQLGGIIAEVEAKDGHVVLAVRDGETGPLSHVTVTIPVLGAYSKTWPLDCPKSDKIVRSLADRLIAEGWDGGIGLNGPRMLFLLSTGEEKDLEVVRGWIKKTVEKSANYGEGNLAYQWHVGWGAPALAEYYLRTGDASVLPLMKQIAAAVRKTMYHDGWAGRGLAGHHMGIAGTSTLTFLLLAKQCGVEMDEGMLQAALQHYYRFAGKGTNPYMDMHPEVTFTDNGRNAMLAYAMKAAAALLPDDKNDIYEQASDIAAMHSFYSTSYMLHGHTGGGIGEVWRSAAMGLMCEKKPAQYRDFMNSRAWWYDLSRRYDGSFGVLGGGAYDTKSAEWNGPTIGLTYTAPRKQLCIFGAPRSKFAKYYTIPERPWGTAADDDFLKIEAAADDNRDIKNYDFETIAADSGLPFNRMLAADHLSDELLMEYARHPQHMFRTTVADRIYRDQRFHLIPVLLRSSDARVRYVGAYAMKHPRVSSIPANCDPGFPMEKMTDVIKERLYEMLEDPKESWFVADHILGLISQRDAEELAPHMDPIIHFLGHDEQWLNQSALSAIIPLAVDKRYSAKALAAIVEHVPNFIRKPNALKALAEKLKDAEPEMQTEGLAALGAIYLAYPGKNANPPGGLHPASSAWYLDSLAETISVIPGGLEKLYEVSRMRYPDAALSHRDSFLRSADLNKAEDRLQKVVSEAILNDLIPEFIAKNRRQLLADAAGEKLQDAVSTLGGSGWREGLSDLYSKAGIKDFDWHHFGPARDQIKWDYFTFDPEEKLNWAGDSSRYRKITMPAGMENWMAVDFDAKKTGWREGRAPFASIDGKLIPQAKDCFASFCRCSDQPNTLWEKEVLLLRGVMNVPEIKAGHRYRFLLGGRAHVGSGDGYEIYFDGKKMFESPEGTGRRVGELPKGYLLPQAMMKELSGQEVMVAVKTFWRKHPRSGEKRGYITVFMEEMKLPPIQEMIGAALKSAPMLSAEWQSLQYPDVVQDDPDEGKFKYDGKFIANNNVVGEWTVIDQVASIEDFTADRKPAKIDPRKMPFKELILQDNGETGGQMIWSGDVLMDLDGGQALAMRVKKVGDAAYLFVEVGGFDAKNGPDWKPVQMVLKRK